MGIPANCQHRRCGVTSYLAAFLRMPGRGDMKWRSNLRSTSTTPYRKYTITKNFAFELPLSDFMVELLRNRIAEKRRNSAYKSDGYFQSIHLQAVNLEGKVEPPRGRSCSSSIGAAHSAHFMDHITLKGQNSRQPPAHALTKT